MKKRKVSSDVALPISAGSSFHMEGPALAKSLSPRVLNIVLGTTSKSRLSERRLYRPTGLAFKRPEI